MAKFLIKTKNSQSVREKPRVYFTSHPEDFGKYFEAVAADIFKTQDCAIYYTEDMSESLTEENLALDLERMNLVVVPVTLKLLVEDNRAMATDIPFAMEKGIPVLPLMMEDGIGAVYSRKDRFGNRQYISPVTSDETAISYEKRLADFLSSTLTDDETAKRVRAAFDAYIFLSYRKKDRKYANELIRIIHSNPKYRDIAIWYDEFIIPGRDFRENISHTLADSRLFALLVTPSLLEKPNFVMDEEYPSAIKTDIGILPVEMVETDRDELKSSYVNIPDCVRADDSLNERLDDMLFDVSIAENDAEPEHNYLIGLAYYEGIDVEVDRERGIALITSAADAGYTPAMERLYFIYDERGDYNSALPWCERLYGLYAEKHSENNDDASYWANQLAVLYDDLGCYERAIEILEQLYSLQRLSLGEEHPDTLFTLNNIADAYNHMSAPEKAISISERVLAIRISTLGKEHPETVGTMNSLAVSYYILGNYEKSHEILTKALDVLCHSLGEESIEALQALVNLSVTHRERGNRYLATSLGKRAYEAMCRTLGEGHPTTLDALVHLAISYYEFGYYDDALELFNKAYTMNLELFGEKHPATLGAANGLALAYSEVDFCNDAVLVMLSSSIYALRKEVLGERHSDTLISLLNLASAYKKTGDVKAATDAARAAYEGFLDVFGEGHPHTLTAKELLNKLTSE